MLVDFIDGSRKRFDMKPIIDKFEPFKRLKDIDEFKTVHTDSVTVVWDDMLDVAPESLYEKGVIV